MMLCCFMNYCANKFVGSNSAESKTVLIFAVIELRQLFRRQILRIHADAAE